jgi:hypothetical protein
VQLSHSEIGQCKDAGAAGGGWELVERCGERGPGFGVVSGLEVNVAGRGSQVSWAVIEQYRQTGGWLRGRGLGAVQGLCGGGVIT